MIVSELLRQECNSQFNLSEYLTDLGSCSQQFFLTFASYFLLLNTMIPISLVVSLEFVKFGQAYYMERDPEMYSHPNQQSLKVFACAVNEELG